MPKAMRTGPQNNDQRTRTNEVTPRLQTARTSPLSSTRRRARRRLYRHALATGNPLRSLRRIGRAYAAGLRCTPACVARVGGAAQARSPSRLWSINKSGDGMRRRLVPTQRVAASEGSSRTGRRS